MKVNFNINSSTEIDYKGVIIDLHNNFNFINFSYSISERKLSLCWIKTIGDWVKDDKVDNITIIHKNISFMNINYDNPIKYDSEDQTLEFISYFPSQNRDVNDGFLVKYLPEKDDDLIYRFENQQFIRVHCSEVELLIF